MVNVDPVSGLRYDEDCKAGVLLPFIKGSAPAETSPCGVPSADTSGAKAEAKTRGETRGQAGYREEKLVPEVIQLKNRYRLFFCFGMAAVACRMCRRGNAAINDTRSAGHRNRVSPPSLRPVPKSDMSGNKAVIALLDRAQIDNEAGQREAAGASLERALRIEPRNPWLWLELAQLRLAQGQYAQAITLARKSNQLRRTVNIVCKP